MTELQITNKILKGATVQEIGAEEIEKNFEVIIDKLDNVTSIDFRLNVTDDFFIEVYGWYDEKNEEEIAYKIESLEQSFRFYSKDEQFDNVENFEETLNSVKENFEEIYTVTYQFLKENEIETLNGLCYEDEESIFIEMECLLPCGDKTSVEWVDTQDCLFYLLQKEFTENYNYSVIKKLNEVLGDLIYNVRTDNVLEEISRKKVVEKILDKIIGIRIYEKFLLNGYTIPIKALIEIEEKLTKEIENCFEDFIL